MMKIMTIMVTVICSVVFMGCSLIVDFSDPGKLYNIQDNLEGVGVVVGATSTASIELTLTSPLPDTDEEDTLEELLGDAIGLTLTNDTGVTVNLSAGSLVDRTPAAEGEFSISSDDAGKLLTVVLWNDFDGHRLQAGKVYTAAISVDANNYFVEQQFSRTVTAQ